MLPDPMTDAVSIALPPLPDNTVAPGPLVILDTQIVMDWLVFDEPTLLPLIAAVESRHLHWVATAAMKAELLHVIGRGVAARYSPDLQRVETAFTQQCRFVEEPSLSIARPRCSDTDDQKFIDLGRELIEFIADAANRQPFFQMAGAQPVGGANDVLQRPDGAFRQEVPA